MLEPSGHAPERSSGHRNLLIGAAVAFALAVLLVSRLLGALRELVPDPSRMSMQYGTAIGFVVTGIALVAHGLGWRRVSLWGGVVAAGLGSLSLADQLAGSGASIVSRIFGDGAAPSLTLSMSPGAALCLALAGGVLLTAAAPGVRTPARRALSIVLASCMVGVGFTGLLGFVTGQATSTGWARIAAMESHAAFGFVALGIGFFLLTFRHRESPTAAFLPNWSVWVVGLGVAGLSVALWTSLSASDARLNSLAATRSHEAAMAHANQLLQSRLKTLERFAAEVAARRADAHGELLRAEAERLVSDLPGLRCVSVLSSEGRPVWEVGASDESLSRAVESRPELRHAISEALRDGEVAVSDPVSVYGRAGDICVFVPVPASGGEAGPGAVVGYVLDAQQMFDWIFGEGIGRAFNVDMAVLGGQTFYRSRGTGSAPRRTANVDPHSLTSGRLAFGNRVWVLTGEADSTWIGGARNASNALILWFGLFLAVALSFVIRKSELLRQRATSLAEAKASVERHAASVREANQSLEEQARHLRVTEANLVREAREKRRVLDSLSAFLVGVDPAGRVVEWNSVAAELLGISDEQALGRRFEELPLPWDCVLVAQAVRECLERGERRRLENLAVTLEGRDPRAVSITVNPTMLGEGRGFVIIGADVTEKQMLEMQLHHAQKLEAVGTLAAGIAHEINTPMQFVSDNVRFVSESVAPVTELLRLMPETLRAARAGSLPAELVERLEQAASGVDVEFLADELPTALSETQEGLGRVTTIVRAMKDFSHPGNQGCRSADLNKAIATTLAVARNEYKYVADIETDFGDLPAVECWVTDLNQVFLNLLVNAAHAIRDVVGESGGRGTIRIRTRLVGECIEMRFSDTGTGIPEAVRPKIFDQFYTTKEIGKGTGLGLAIARSVVVEKHGGTISFETELGKGTTFIVSIPCRTPAGAQSESHPELESA